MQQIDPYGRARGGPLSGRLAIHAKNTIGSPTSKYKHWETSAFVGYIPNVRICMGKTTYRFNKLFTVQPIK